MRILFITSNRIGDAVLTTGVLNHLIETYPQARFTVACGPLTVALFKPVPQVEKIISLHKRKRWGHWVCLWRSCVLTRWDLIVDLRNSLITRLMRADKKLYKRARKSGRHKVIDHGAILGLDPPPSPRLWIDQDSAAHAASLVAEEGRALALGPAANWPAKQWPAVRFAELALQLTGPGGSMEGAPILILAAEHERSQLAPLFDMIPAARRVDLIGLDLVTAAACLRRARLFIGNDSGLTHMAAAVGTPTLALFGPGWEHIYGPWGDHTATLRKEDVDVLLDRLPYPGAFEPNLMSEINIADARKAAENLLKTTAP